jgi:hypothetical protein
MTPETKIRNKTLDDAIAAMRERQRFFDGMEKNSPKAKLIWETAVSSFQSAERILENMKTR